MASGEPAKSSRVVGLLCGLTLIAGAVGLAVRLFRPAALAVASLPAAKTPGPEGMVLIPAGKFRMGNDLSHSVGDRPQHEVQVESFWLDVHEVTVAQFAEFIAATDYETTAQRTGHAWVFVPGRKQWVTTPGADWRHPLGPHSSTVGFERLPVYCQVSWHDGRPLMPLGPANAYLPTEAGVGIRGTRRLVR